MPRHTPDPVVRLGRNEYIVVGTNIAGRHGAGAAAAAHAHFGLQWGCGEGLSGQAYALPTMEGHLALRIAALRFLLFALHNPDKRFYLTRVGCGFAGFADAEVAPLFDGSPPNVIKPKGW